MEPGSFSRQEGQRNAIFQALELRLGRVPTGLREELLAVNDSERLARLFHLAVTASDFEAFAEGL